MKTFGDYVRQQREAKRADDSSFSVRKFAERVGIEPSYLSKIERGEQSPPSETTIAAIARELDEDKDVLLALAGKVSTDLQEAIRKRPKLFAQIIRDLRRMPDDALLRRVREVRDGKW